MSEIFQQGEREGKDVRLGLALSIGTGVPPSRELENVGVEVPRLRNILKTTPITIGHKRAISAPLSRKCDLAESARE